MKNSVSNKLQECKQCYTCQQGVASNVTADTFKQQNKKADVQCKTCYTCQQGVVSNVNINTFKKQQSKMNETQLCKNCYTCQQGVSPAVTAKKSYSGMEFVWYVFPSGSFCNLGCKYCYAYDKPGMMKKDVMHDVLQFLFYKQPHKRIRVHFFGGEPTVNWKILYDFVEIGKAMSKQRQIDVKFSMTTNGTLLDSDKIDWLKQNFTHILLSLDGRPETHNKYRVDKKGKGSFEMIPLKALLQAFPNLEVRPTINPDTAKDWFEDY
ncbi:MAG: radical SAM protein, partial [Promethearchaeota archaeon]